jgi:hypothetical protein
MFFYDILRVADNNGKFIFIKCFAYSKYKGDYSRDGDIRGESHRMDLFVYFIRNNDIIGGQDGSEILFKETNSSKLCYF